MKLIIPALGPFYDRWGGIAETLLRVIAGVVFIAHGYVKMQDPFAAAGMVEGLGFYPGVFWSPLLSATEFFGGILLTIGLLTRPAALATTIVLLVTIWFHWIAMAQGFAGAEKSILWTAMCFYFVIHGGNRWSVDRLIGRAF